MMETDCIYIANPDLFKTKTQLQHYAISKKPIQRFDEKGNEYVRKDKSFSLGGKENQ